MSLNKVSTKGRNKEEEQSQDLYWTKGGIIIGEPFVHRQMASLVQGRWTTSTGTKMKYTIPKS